MKYQTIASIVIAATCCISTAAHADVFGALKSAATKELSSSDSSTSTSSGSSSLSSLEGLLPGGTSSSLTSKTASNAAGILEYCIKNNVVSNADSVKNKLLEKIGLQQEAKQQNDESFKDGLKGILHGDTSTVDLSAMTGKMKEKVTTEACDLVLKNAKSFL